MKIILNYTHLLSSFDRNEDQVIPTALISLYKFPLIILLLVFLVLVLSKIYANAINNDAWEAKPMRYTCFWCRIRCWTRLLSSILENVEFWLNCIKGIDSKIKPQKTAFEEKAILTLVISACAPYILDDRTKIQSRDLKNKLKQMNFLDERQLFVNLDYKTNFYTI